MQRLFCYPTSVFWLYFFVIKGLGFYKYQSGKKDLVIFLVIGSYRKKIQGLYKYQSIVRLFFVENPNINFFVLWHLCWFWMPYILKQPTPTHPTRPSSHPKSLEFSHKIVGLLHLKDFIFLAKDFGFLV